MEHHKEKENQEQHVDRDKNHTRGKSGNREKSATHENETLQTALKGRTGTMTDNNEKKRGEKKCVTIGEPCAPTI
jgi:hypothetical protein